MTPEALLLTSDYVVNVFPVPGTPSRQKGQQLVVVHQADGVLAPHIHEIVVLEHMSRIVELCRTEPFECWSASTLNDAPNGGTNLSSQMGLTVEQGLGRSMRPQLETQLREELWRTKRAIESGARFPSQDGRHEDKT